MSTRHTVDIVFCLDASSSMQPCFRAMQQHVGNFIAGIAGNGQSTWDWRIDFVAHSAGNASVGSVHRMTSLSHNVMELVSNLYRPGQSGRFFTSNLEEFKTALGKIEVQGDEAPLLALDTCLDFPWRPAAGCHRVVILMTDEPAETGLDVDESRKNLPALIQKVQDLKVLLFIVAPESAIFDQLGQINKSEYEVVDATDDGMASVDFRQLMEALGKSVSVSTLQSTGEKAVQRGLFGQAKWVHSNEEIRGA